MVGQGQVLGSWSKLIPISVLFCVSGQFVLNMCVPQADWTRGPVNERRVTVAKWQKERLMSLRN